MRTEVLSVFKKREDRDRGPVRPRLVRASSLPSPGVVAKRSVVAKIVRCRCEQTLSRCNVAVPYSGQKTRIQGTLRQKRCSPCNRTMKLRTDVVSWQCGDTVLGPKIRLPGMLRNSVAFVASLRSSEQIVAMPYSGPKHHYQVFCGRLVLSLQAS